jgi:hypothetical protein
VRAGWTPRAGRRWGRTDCAVDAPGRALRACDAVAEAAPKWSSNRGWGWGGVVEEAEVPARCPRPASGGGSFRGLQGHPGHRSRRTRAASVVICLRQGRAPAGMLRCKAIGAGHGSATAGSAASAPVPAVVPALFGPGSPRRLEPGSSRKSPTACLLEEGPKLHFAVLVLFQRLSERKVCRQRCLRI